MVNRGRLIATTPSFDGGFQITSLDCRGGPWRSCAGRHDPKLNGVAFTETTVHDNDARVVDAAFVDKIVTRARHQSIDLSNRARLSAIHDDVGVGRRVVL